MMMTCTCGYVVITFLLRDYEDQIVWCDHALKRFFLLNFGSRLSPWSNRFKATETKTISCENRWRNLLFCLYIERESEREMKQIASQISSLMSWPQHREYTSIIQDLSVNWIILGQEYPTTYNLAKVSFKFSAFGLKCLPGDKFKKNGSPIF